MPISSASADEPGAGDRSAGTLVQAIWTINIYSNGDGSVTAQSVSHQDLTHNWTMAGGDFTTPTTSPSNLGGSGVTLPHTYTWDRTSLAKSSIAGPIKPVSAGASDEPPPVLPARTLVKATRTTDPHCQGEGTHHEIRSLRGEVRRSRTPN